MTEQEYLLILNAVSGLGSIRIRRLLEYFGSAESVLSAGLEKIEQSAIAPPSVARNIASFKKESFLKEELNLVKKNKASFVTLFDQEYPKNLKEIPDAPIVLYVKGTLCKENDLAVALVGSRRASFYGLSTAEKLAMQLAELGLTVVSGMARGIDTAAHRGALKAKGLTLAVLGCGLTHAYPLENKKLFEEIAQKGGVVSEFSMQTPPIAHNFPRRNRIISGLSLGVVVVEASQKSGALITSDFALEQGREVFAVPGKVDNPSAKGVNNLIKQGAKLISTVDDIIEELKLPLKNYLKDSRKQEAKTVNQVQPPSLSENENSVYVHIDKEAVHVDDITDRCGFSLSQTMAILLNLELKKMIKQLPGKYFSRLNDRN